MIIRNYEIDCPDELYALRECAKTELDSTRLRCNAAVWNVARRKQGKASWDGNMFVEMYAHGSERRAHVVRLQKQGTVEIVAALKYNAALKYCDNNLLPTKEIPEPSMPDRLRSVGG